MQKLYSMSGMFEGSFEERSQMIRAELPDYLVEQLGLKDDEYWGPYYQIVATYEKEVIVNCPEKGKAYQVEYEKTEDGVEFTSISPVKFTYEVDDDMDTKTVTFGLDTDPDNDDDDDNE